MRKLIIYYSLLGGGFLMFSRCMSTMLFYLTGYLIFLSYIIIISLLIVSVKKKHDGLVFIDYLKLTLCVLFGMTLMYSLLVLIFIKLIGVKW
jgi:hypothetical protein